MCIRDSLRGDDPDARETQQRHARPTDYTCKYRMDLTLPLDEAPAAYRAMDERRAIKVLLQP